MQTLPRTVLAVLPLLLGGGCQGLIGELPPVAQQAPDRRPEDPAAPLLPVESLPAFSPAPLRARQLLRWQYEESVRVLLGDAAAAAVVLPADVPLNGFAAVGASQLAPTPVAVRAWELSAHAAAEAAFAGGLPPGLVPCSPAAADDAACLGAFARSFGRRAFRRPVTDEEVSTWTAVGRAAAQAYGRFDRGVQFVVAGMLQSPAFLYLAEVGEPDGDAGRLRLTRYELAARLSYFLAGIPPPEGLMAAAEAGALDTADGLRAEARRLLALPSAARARAAFFDEWLELGRLDGLSKDPGTYPLYSPALASAMRQETQAFLGDLVARGADFRDFLDAPDTFVNADLARLYGIADVPASGFQKRTYPASTLRGGVLGHAALMAGLAHPRLTSPTRRGRFVRERLLCQPVGAAPPGVNAGMFSAASEAGHVTLRERLAVHLEEPSCAGCHVLMDGIGLGLENYDAVGAFRPDDEGLPIDAVSTLDSLGTFAGSRQLGTLLRNHPRTLDCLVRNLFRVAVGRVETDGEARPLRAALDRFAASGHRLDEVLVELAASDAFRFATKEETP
ncbi:MAG: hypothetical protein RL653_938 [Pseudomonadota bacterium]|jgi:hypothetical protein